MSRLRSLLLPSILLLTAPSSALAQAPSAASGPGSGYSSSGDQGGFAASGVQLLAHLSLADLDGSSSGNDCWGYTSPSGREYALMGTSLSTIVVEITQPTDPTIVAVIPGKPGDARDMKTYLTYAYVVAEESTAGLQIIDLAQVDAGVVTHLKYFGTGRTHNVALDEDSGFVYRISATSGSLVTFDLANPEQPVPLGSWSDRSIHDAQAVTYTTGPFAGRRIVFACSDGTQGEGLDILDVTNMASVQVLSRVFYSGATSHQGWLSDDRQYFYLDDESDEPSIYPTSTTHVFDVSDLTNAFYAGNFTNGNTSNDHNLYVKGNFIYEANYTSGLRVFDKSADPLAPVEVAWFDTYPATDGTGFLGLWSCYPFFDSGVVIGSDQQSGLFVWLIGDALLEVALPAGAPEILSPGGDAVPVTITESAPGELQAGSEKLFYDAGAGVVEVPLTDLGGGSYEATFPALPCQTDVSWYVEARSSNGFAWRCPVGAPNKTFRSTALVSTLVAHEDDLEAASGWTVGAADDDATTGIWVRLDPLGTGAQPEDDHTDDPATMCFVTGQGTVGGSIGENDVDDGKTTLFSPVFNVANLPDARVAYWRWFSNNAGVAPNTDIMVVEITTDGSTWSTLETVGPVGPETSGGWFRADFRVADFGSPTNKVQLRFVPSDEGTGSIVEAAVDDLRVYVPLCAGPVGGTYCEPAVPNSTGVPAGISAVGSDVPTDNSFTVFATELPAKQFGYLLASQTQGFVMAPPGAQGNLCLGGTIVRFTMQAQSSGTYGVFQIDVDLMNIPPPHNGAVMSGETWNWQAWYRDKNPTSTSNFTPGLTLQFQ